MSYLNCPRCGLTLDRHDPAPDDGPGASDGRTPVIAGVTPTGCPRCRGRAGLEVPMFVTARRRPPVSRPEPQAA